LKCAVKALGRHGLDKASATKFLMDKTMGANIIPFDNVCTWYPDKETRPSYNVFAKDAHPLMTEIFNSLTAKSFRREQNLYFLVGMYSIFTYE